MRRVFMHIWMGTICTALCLTATSSLGRAQPASINFDGQQFTRKSLGQQGHDYVVAYGVVGEGRADWTQRVILIWSPGSDIWPPEYSGGLKRGPKGETIVHSLLPIPRSEEID